jgi:hypothetical protein
LPRELHVETRRSCHRRRIARHGGCNLSGAIMIIAEPSQPTALLRAHSHVDKLLGIICTHALAGQMSPVAAPWRELRDTLLSHLAEEEATILPRFSLADPADAAKIVRDHARIRRQLGEVDEELSRGVMRRAKILSVVSFFRMHHYHEEAGMYRWAWRHPVETVS